GITHSLIYVTLTLVLHCHTTMHHENDWIASFAPAHSDPLANAADLDGLGLVDSVGGNDFVEFTKDRVSVRRSLHARRERGHRRSRQRADEGLDEKLHA